MENRIALWIIDKMDTAAYRSGKLKSGEKHPKVDGKMIEVFGGREAMVRQARELEQISELKGKISFGWRDMYSDIKVIDYDIVAVPILCKLIGMEDDVLLHCLREMSLLQEPEWKRVFSVLAFIAHENRTAMTGTVRFFLNNVKIILENCFCNV